MGALAGGSAALGQVEGKVKLVSAVLKGVVVVFMKITVDI
jgi:hypothetical protein